MKTGKSLIELATEIERQKAAATDMIVDTRSLSFTEVGEVVVAEPAKVVSPRPITSHALRQIGDRVGIPAKYVDRLAAEAPSLLATNVNHWFQNKPEKRMVRTLDGRVRAFLSDRYQRIDNHHVANVVLPILARTSGIDVVSTEITEQRLYIKAVTHAVRAEIQSRRVGDIVEAGVLISNSEIGSGSLQVLPFFHFLVCTNGLVRNKDGLRKYHVGAREVFEGDLAVLSDNTKRLEDAATLSKVGDVLRAALDQSKFNEAVAKMQGTVDQRITGKVEKAVEVLGESFGFVSDESESVLKHLIEGGDLSRYGLMNAVTRTAEDLKSYDRATEFETFGGALRDLAANDWRAIAEAA